MQVLTEIPAGVESGWHMHPGEEVGYTTYIVEAEEPLATLTPAGTSA